MVRVFVFVIFILFCQQIFAARILIVTDQEKGIKAEELKKLFLKTPPFSKMEPLEIQVKVVPKNLVKCSQNNDINDRLIKCYENELRNISLSANADRTIFIKEDSRYGGSGGLYPITTTGSPTSIGLHEFLHYYGFVDEYAFTDKEAKYYCDRIRPGPNLAIFDDRPPYESDTQAKNVHSSNISWANKILPSTPITNGNQLGTPTKKKIGLYPANLCPNIIKTWKPEDVISIMQDANSTYIPMATWDALAVRMQVKIKNYNMAVKSENGSR